MSPDRLIEAALDPRESRRTRIARRFTITAFFALSALCLLLTLYVVVLVRQTQLDNKATLQSTESTSAQIRDCTEPEGSCFKESQRRTIKLVQGIVDEITTTRQVSILAAACSTDPALKDLTRAERVNAIDLCVQAALRVRR